MGKIIIFAIAAVAMLVLAILFRREGALSFLFTLLLLAAIAFLADAILTRATGQGIMDRLIQILRRYQDYVSQKMVKRR